MNNLKPQQKELLEAIDCDDLSRVKHLVKREGISPNFGLNGYIETNPICYASLKNNVDIAFWLIDESGAEINEEIARFVTLVIGDISTSNHIYRKLREKK